MTKLTRTTLKRLLMGLAGTRADEIGCDECWDQLDRFAELELTGKEPAHSLPLVEDHLRRCGECREEYEALLAALKDLPGRNPVT